MSVVLPSLRPVHRSQSEVSEIAAIARARRIVCTLGGRFSLELGIDLERDPEEVERWALAATLLGNHVSPSVALRTYRVLEQAGVRTIEDAGGRDREELVALLDEGGYTPFGNGTASRLLALADAIAGRYEGRLATLRGLLDDSEELEQALGALPGWGRTTARTFLRELRGVWPGADIELDHRAVAAAGHLELPAGAHTLASLASAAHLDLRDLEAALVRLSLCHDLADCAGGEECPFAAFEHDQFVHF